MTKKKFDGLPRDQKTLLREQSAKYLARLMGHVKEDNSRSIKVMSENGDALAEMPDSEALKRFHESGDIIRSKLVGKLISKEAWEKVLDCLQKVR